MGAYSTEQHLFLLFETHRLSVHDPVPSCIMYNGRGLRLHFFPCSLFTTDMTEIAHFCWSCRFKEEFHGFIKFLSYSQTNQQGTTSIWSQRPLLSNTCVKALETLAPSRPTHLNPPGLIPGLHGSSLEPGEKRPQP
ncbi:hypothetical protein AFLA_007965 [Aspergillus flavus NRRL3357]|nr:hypothetical protein AFLA_007965 [Aspergillus flavus NRRL3357]